MPETHRYDRQRLLAEIGEEGQRRLGQSNALLVGCGALGSVIADSLVRAGVGRLRLVDRDLVDITNLQRQILFDETDVEQALPKAEAARRKLEKINSLVKIEPVIDDFNHTNAERYAADVDILIDGLDNFETRYILNDLAVKHGLPYVYGGAVATSAMTATFLPHAPDPKSRGRRRWSEEDATPCLRCAFASAPPPGSAPTCDTVGVLGPAVGVIASLQAAEAIKILTGRFDAINRALISIDVWRNEFRRLNIARAWEINDCPCCKRGRYESLAGRHSSLVASLCGRDTMQISPANKATMNLESLERRLRPVAQVIRNPFLLRARLHEGDMVYDLAVFPNGRVLIQGTTRPEVARTIYSKYIGA